MAKDRDAAKRYAAQNRRARHDYSIVDTIEAGIQLTGTEVKVLRLGRVSIAEAYAAERGGELYLFNAHFPEYPSSRFNHEPKRPRKLLVHKRELNKMLGAVTQEGMTLVPLALYFNPQGRAKLELAIAKGRHKADKRAAIKEREWKRDKSRLMRGEKG
ncbi:MAG: SsrA-binding protein SmpB [Alphaproteobacteria bacterium]|nr:SsrA-binding protein SmpB [Alphaproteobacteria bacterium]